MLRACASMLAIVSLALSGAGGRSQGEPAVESRLEILAVSTGEREIVYSAQAHFEAPNWSRDGKTLLFNQGGRIYLLPLATRKPALLDTGSATRCNNDHGLSPDGKWLAISHSPQGDSLISVLPSAGGPPRLVTPRGPSYWHGWSPDGATLAYCARRGDDFDVYTIPVGGGAETRLTTAPGLDDGPDYAPDGRIWFNSVRTGAMKIWRMDPDGGNQVQVTRNEEWADWFPHPSPDGRWVIFLSYDRSVEGHPPNKDVVLRLVPLAGGEPKVVARVFGGQGTINVPSWSPDSTRVAFVSYRLPGQPAASVAGGTVPAPAPAAPPVRGIYGGIPREIVDGGQGLREFGVDAVWLGSGSINDDGLAWLRAQGVKVYAEFNTLHVSDYLKDHPDAAPVGADGQVSPPPDGWQGICPTHEGYRAERMKAFRTLLESFEIDGVWLDYHHAHASWEQAAPNMPDTCFCERCLSRFQSDSGLTLPQASTSERAALLLSKHREAWTRWRLGVFTDWVREFHGIRDGARPGALLGTFHNPWTDEDFSGARLEKLAIDLKAQAAYVDVFSPMPYHARFGHAADPAWISRQVAWLGRHLGVEGRPGERLRIWPIVQLSDWGESVPVGQADEVLRRGAQAPSTGVLVFAWGGLRSHPEKIDAIGRTFRALGQETGAR